MCGCERVCVGVCVSVSSACLCQIKCRQCKPIQAPYVRWLHLFHVVGNFKKEKKFVRASKEEEKETKSVYAKRPETKNCLKTGKERKPDRTSL